MQFLMFIHMFDLFTQAQIARANALYAVRPADLISSQREQVRGRGKYKVWLPEAVLRCAFGNCQSHSRIIGKQSRTPNAMAHSARAQGAWLSANHKYVQQVRNAVSCWIWSKDFLNIFHMACLASCHCYDAPCAFEVVCLFALHFCQEKEVLAAPGAWKHKIMKIALDETESLATVDDFLCSQPFAHAASRCFSRASDDACAIHHVAAPPMFIADQPAECVMDAVQNRFWGSGVGSWG